MAKGHIRPLFSFCFYCNSLKVHKRENIQGSDIELCTFSYLVILKYEGFVKQILLGHYCERYDYSAYTEIQRWARYTIVRCPLYVVR
jgi:hypothetical protein